jgi:endonuclease III
VQKTKLKIGEVLGKLEKFYGAQKPSWPTEPYEFLVWWHCGYPASDAACAKGWEKLNNEVGIEPEMLLNATPAKMAAALKAGGMVPELRAQRLKEIARRVQDELVGELRSALSGPISAVRRLLKRFPGIADPGADRILLFAGIAPIAAVPSNCVHVLMRIVRGKEYENYGTNYREAQLAIESEVPETMDARARAYLLLKHHGQETCKRSKPKCEECPVRTNCAYFERAKKKT